MLAGVAVSLLLIAAPDKADTELSAVEKKLRVAWASQYEWREDKLENVSIAFKWESKTTAGGDNKDESVFTGTGQAVVVGHEIVRVHVDGFGDAARPAVAEGARWVLRRYVRKPYEEQFKDLKIESLGESLSGAEKIKAGPVTYLIKEDRIIAEVHDFGTEKKPIEVRIDFKLADMGNGYARVRELYTHVGNMGQKLTTSSELTPRSDSEVPMPQAYAYTRDRLRGGKVAITLTFDKPRVNQPTAATIDNEAMALVRAAWLNRFVLPNDIRILAEFERKPDRALAKAGWSRVEGELRVDGMDTIEVEVSEKSAGRRWRARITETCLRHFKRAFAYLKDTPFEQEFAGCGFSFAQKGTPQVVYVFGHKRLSALLIEDEAVVGERELGKGVDDWIRLDVKKDRQGRAMIERLTVVVDGKKVQGKWTYGRSKGQMIPRRIQMPVYSGDGGSTSDVGVVEYSLSKLRVEVPKG